MRTAYTGANTEGQLAHAEHAYINHPRGVRLKADAHLQISSLFVWYQEDFAADQTALLAYLASHHVSLANALLSYDGPVEDAYDWALNGSTVAER